MFNKLISLIFLMVSLMFIISCSDDSNPTKPEEQKAKELSLKEITVPEAMKNSQDPHAQMASAYIGLVNGFRNYSTFYQPPAGSSNLGKIFKSNDEWTRTWTVDALTVTMNYFESEENFGWNIYLTGTDNEFTYNNWLYMEAEQTVGENSGTMKIYKPVTDQVEAEWNWFYDTNGKYNFTFFSWNENYSQKIEVVSNPDNSGQLTFYEYVNGQFVPTNKISWTSAGTGHWVEYDAQGNIIDEGDF